MSSSGQAPAGQPLYQRYVYRPPALRDGPETFDAGATPAEADRADGGL